MGLFISQIIPLTVIYLEMFQLVHLPRKLPRRQKRLEAFGAESMATIAGNPKTEAEGRKGSLKESNWSSKEKVKRIVRDEELPASFREKR